MIRTLAHISILAAAIPAAASSQLTGLVLDPSSRGIPDARVRCAAHEARTDSRGRFVLDRSEPCRASIQADGFDPATVQLDTTEEVQVVLAISALNDRIVVSATRTPTSIEEAGVSATVFTASDLSIRQTPMISDLLRDAPGINLMSAGRRGSITGIFTRGSQSTATLLLLDGVPLNEPGGQVNPANFTTSGLDRVEVVRGAESALFGAEAAAGVVQLFTARGDTEARLPRGSVVYERGNFQTDRWIANLNGGLFRNIDYSLTADQFHTAGKFPNDYFRNTTGTANIGARLSGATQVRAVFREFDAVVANPGQVGFGEFDSDAFGGDRARALSIRLDDVRGPRFVHRVSFNYSRLRNIYRNTTVDGPFSVAALLERRTAPTPRVYLVRQVPTSFSPSEVPSGLELVTSTIYDFPSPFEGVFNRKNADYQGTWTHTGGALVFGYRYERQGGLISTRDVGRTNNGGFFHEQYSIGRRLFFTGGARIENSTTFGSRFVPRGSATLQVLADHGPLSATYVRISGGRGFTEPSLLQNFAREAFYVGNPDLRPEKTTMFDAGIVQELFGRRVRAEATYFRNSFRDLIVFDGSLSPASWNNIDRSWARGLETSVTARPFRYLQISGNYTRLYTKITRTNTINPYSGVGQELPRRPKNSGAAWVSISPRRWSLMVGGRAVGERRDTDFVYGITRNPRYGTMFVNASYNLTRHVMPYLRMDNALNERYEEVLGYTALTRSVIGGMRVSW